MVPSSGLIIRFSIRIIVVLPLPLRPMMQVTCPDGISSWEMSTILRYLTLRRVNIDGFVPLKKASRGGCLRTPIILPLFRYRNTRDGWKGMCDR
jgi:hypothetical protein